MEPSQQEQMEFDQDDLFSWGSFSGCDALDLFSPLPSPLPSPQAATAAQQQPSQQRRTQTGKRARPSGEAARSSSAYRGLSHHPRSGRFESHIYFEGRQIYLGSFLNEEVAACAYDLAAVRVRGDQANTNLPLHLYSQELAEGSQVPLEVLVKSLRSQAKAMARLEATAGAQAACRMESWELELSEAASGQQSLGVYASEAEAAQAVDLALLVRDGLAAAPMLSFPLASYVPYMSPALLEGVLREGLLTVVSPSAVGEVAAAAMGVHMQPIQVAMHDQMEEAVVRLQQQPGMMEAAVQPSLLHPVLPLIACPAVGGSSLMDTPQPDPAAGAADCSMAPPLPQPVARKASITPRMSLLG